MPGVKALGPSSKVRATVPGTEQLLMIEPDGGGAWLSVGGSMGF